MVTVCIEIENKARNPEWRFKFTRNSCCLLQEREKKLKKKAAASATATNSEEQAEETIEQELDVTPEAPVLEKEKVQKEKTTVRHRGRVRGSESIPKVIPRRKKSTDYWVWAAPAAVALVMLLVALGYQYFA